MSPQEMDPVKPLGHQVEEEPDNFIDDVKEELIEAKDSFIEEVKNTVLGLGNSVFGDFGLFFAVIKTVWSWFKKPTSLNVREVEKENLALKGAGKKIRFFTDFNLIKSIFMLSLTFLVIEETAAHASTEHWIEQIVFFMFFVALLFVFIGLMWLWKVLLNFQTGDSRVFIGFLIYQYATVYIVSFLINGPFGIDTSTANGTDLSLAVYGFQVLHSLYFLAKLIKYYQLAGWRKAVGWILGFAFLAFLVFFPQIITEIFLVQGLGD